MSIEKANVSRATETYSTKEKTISKSAEALRQAIANDKLERDKEERVRMAVYQRIGVLSLNIKQIPADQYDEMKRNDPFEGRCLFSFADERSGAGIDVTPFSRWDAEVEELIEDKPEIETEAVEEEEPEREDGLTVVSVEELEEVATT
jgi:hypothetical protein